MQKNALCGRLASIVLSTFQPRSGFGSGRYVIKTLLVMKLTIILLTAVIVQVSAKGLSQTVSFDGKNAPLQEVLSAIEKQTGFVVICNKVLLDKANPVSLKVTNVPLKDFLGLIFKNQSLGFSIKETTIFISSKIAEADRDKQVVDMLTALPIPISGRILDVGGQPLVGASVLIKGSQKSTLTGADGMFSINANDKDIIQVSYIGYSGLSFKISQSSGGVITAVVVSSDQPSSSAEANDGSSSLINLAGTGTSISLIINLKRNVSKLDEVQIIAYGTTTKRLNTGTVSTVKAADIGKQPVSNPLATLQGRMTGVVITQNTGMPGGGFTVQVRGRNSVRPQGNAPFYIIDGVPFTSATSLGSSYLGSNGVYNPLNSIDPSTIESIDVLKDADATAIYGSRGANGVILITTKKGQAGKTKVDVDVNTGIGKTARKIDLLNTQQYLAMRHEAFNNDGATPQFWDYDLLQWDTTRYTDWQKTLIGGTARITNAQVAISGGNSNTQFLLGGGYRRESTVFPGNSADQKASVHFNITNASTNQKFKALLTGSYVTDNNKLPSTDLTSKVLGLAPDAPALYDSVGNLNWENSTWDNPLASLRQKYKGNTSNLVGNAILSYQVARGLQLKASMGYNKIQMNEVKIIPLASYDPAYWPYYQPTSYFSESSITSWIIEPQAEYQAMLGKGKISAIIGTTFQQNESKTLGLSASGFTSDALLENIQAASNVTVNTSNYIQYRYNAFFGRINYFLQDKYILNLTGRRDGSSRFGPGKQFANFGAIGAAWIFSKEDVVKRALPFLSFGKLRGSYGITGNDQIPDYGYLSLWNPTTRPYGGIQGLYPNNLLSPDYAWERNKKLEGGLELGFAKDRILFSVSYYRNRSDNQLIGSLLPVITGFSSIQANLPAKVQNTGIELELNTVNIRTKDITWNTSFNMTIARNKLIAYPGLASSSYASTYVIGEPLNIVKLYRSKGVDPATGIYVFEDQNGQTTATPSYPADFISVRNLSPDFYGGLSNSVQYKGWQLDIHFQFVKQLGGNYLYGSFQAPGMAANQPTTVLNRWQHPGDHTDVQQFTQTYGDAYSAFSNASYFGDNAISDASFIRLKNVSLSYQLPITWREKLRVQNCRIYVQGQNLLTITHYQGLDPENQNMFILPPLRMITTGIQLTF